MIIVRKWNVLLLGKSFLEQVGLSKEIATLCLLGSVFLNQGQYDIKIPK